MIRVEDRKPTVSGYPLQLRSLDGASVLVVGAGDTAAGKIEPLIDAGARVRVVAEHIGDRVRSMNHVIAVIEERRFEANDVEGVAMVIAATNDTLTNGEVADAARGAAVLTHVVDEPERSTFDTPAILRRGGVTIAVATDEGSALVSSRLAHLIDAALPIDCAKDFPRKRVAIVGAGLGGRDDLTLRALARIKHADVLFFDPRVTRDVLEQATPPTQLVRIREPRAVAIEKMIDAARAGARVVRLYAGDPPLLERAREELAFEAAGVDVEYVPGAVGAEA